MTPQALLQYKRATLSKLNERMEVLAWDLHTETCRRNWNAVDLLLASIVSVRNEINKLEGAIGK